MLHKKAQVEEVLKLALVILVVVLFIVALVTVIQRGLGS